MTPFWAIYAVVVALCIATVLLRGRAQMITFVVWFIVAVLDVIILVRSR